MYFAGAQVQTPELEETTNLVSAPVLSGAEATTNLVGAPAPLGTSIQSSLSPRVAGNGQLAAVPQLTNTPPESLLEWGPITLRPHLLYSLSYAHGLQAAPGQPVNTTINEIDPGILLQLGNHWTLDYTPTLRYYSSRLYRDTFDNQVTLAGGTAYKDWTFGFTQSYVSSTQPLVETGGQLESDTYLTTLNALYGVSTALSLELNANQTFQYLGQGLPGEQLSDWRSWSTMDWLNYQLLPNFGAAVGAGFEYDYLTVGPDMTAEFVEGRLTWRAGRKLNVILSGGLQDRQFLDSGESDNLAPIFSLVAQYQLFEPTRLFLSAGRTVSPAFFAGQLNENTFVSGGVNQRLFRRLMLTVTGSYGKTTYQNTAPISAPTAATDFDNTSLNVSLNTAFLRRATASLFYQLTYYSSAAAVYNYDTYQVGFSLGYRF